MGKTGLLVSEIGFGGKWLERHDEAHSVELIHSYRGNCTYCGHCRPCPMNIDIAMVNKFYDLAIQQAEVPESVRQHYLSLDVTAEACISCHSCGSRCPFEVNIAERMAKASALFGK